VTARVALVDDHALFREGLRVVLGRHPEFVVVGEAATAREAIALASSTSLDVAVVDVSLPEVSGVSVAHDLRRLQPECRVLALSMLDEPAWVVDLLRAGAAGYALKSQSCDEIVVAIRAVLAGDRYLAPRLPRAHIDRLIGERLAGPMDLLSRREREVFELLVRGWGNDRIAAALYIAPRTVETHRQHIMDKLDLHSVVELVRLAAHHNLLGE
jgi:two-component system response regulator NreC